MYIETMSRNSDYIAFYNDLPPEEQARFKANLAQDPSLAEAFGEWQGVREEVGRSFNQLVPNRRVLTLYALEQKGGGDLLDEAERCLLNEEREHIEAAIRASPAIARIVAQIKDEQADFETVWTLHSASAPVERSAEVNNEPLSPWRPVHSAWRGVGRWAAVFAVAIFAGLLYWAGQSAPEIEAVYAKAGEIRVLELSDGTRVRLMENSKLTFNALSAGEPFNRYVVLTGKALFDVQPGEQPFIVETATAQTRVLGTTFGVETSADGTSVVLVEGKVQFSGVQRPDQHVMLKPGEMSRVNDAGPPSEPVAVAVADALKWTRLFVFRGTPVKEVAAQLSAHYHTPVTVDPALANERFHGTYEQNWTLDYILNTLSEGLDATYSGNMGEGYALVPSP